MEKTVITRANRHLSRHDPVMAKLIKLHQPFSFDNDSKNSTTSKAKKVNHFHTLVRTIICQQLSVKAAQTIQARLQKKQGGRSFNAKKLQLLSDPDMRECGISKNKVRYIRAIALAVIDKHLNFTALEKMDDEAVIESLIQLPGIGLWSAELFLMISFKRLDVLPLGDLIIRKSMQRLYGLDNASDYEIYREIAKPWQPYRTIASRYLWASASSNK